MAAKPFKDSDGRGYSDETHALIERMCRNVEREDFVLHKEEGAECVLKTYDLFNLPRPKTVVWCSDLTDARFQESARSAWSARSAKSARSAMSARSARSARSAWSAMSARSARSAISAWSALDYDFDWYIFEAEYTQSNDDTNEHDAKCLAYHELLMQAKEYGVGYRVEWQDTLYLVPTPLVKIDKQNRFHSDREAAIRWKGGQEVYLLHGIRFDKDLWEKVVKKTMRLEDVLKIQDIDQRRQAMKYVSFTDFAKYQNAEVIDTYQKIAANGDVVSYELYKFPAGEVFNKEVKYIRHFCPSTHDEYVHGVPNLPTVAAAEAWMFDTTEEDWKLLVPLSTES